MSDIANPKNNPNLAAQQVVLALIENNTFGVHTVSNSETAIRVADSIVEVHKHLTAYYRSLDEAQ